MLVLLYYFSQNPDFAESVKPIMSQLKNSQQMLCFLNDLSKFTQTFSSLKQDGERKTDTKKDENFAPKTENNDDKEKTSQSPTEGIADAFIQQILESYLKKSN